MRLKLGIKVPEKEGWRATPLNRYVDHIYHEQYSSYDIGGSEYVTFVDLPTTFYAVLQVNRFENLGTGFLTWMKDVCTGIVYPMNDKGLRETLLKCEWQGVGIVDGKWRLRKKGRHVSIYPVTTDDESGDAL